MGGISAVMLDMLVVSSSTPRRLFAAGIVFIVSQQKNKPGGEIQ
jgi:hypothetical protein